MFWKTLVNGYKIGRYWSHIPGYEERAKCATCNTEESMTHILTECRAVGQKELWSLVEELWKKKHHEWHEVSIGSILTCGMADFRTRRGKRRPGTNRLFRILVSETAYLIWVLRCQRVIEWEGEREHTLNEVKNRWMHAINQRLTLDQVMTRKNFERKALPRRVVLRTWEGVLKHRTALPDDWIGEAGVLVGIG